MIDKKELITQMRQAVVYANHTIAEARRVCPGALQEDIDKLLKAIGALERSIEGLER